jgi:hypothetical protein
VGLNTMNGHHDLLQKFTKEPLKNSPVHSLSG